jgi:DNA-binding XRE family transcriptional regulator
MSKLKSYRQTVGITQAKFAEKVDALQGTISKIERGLLVPNLSLALRIEVETGGMVLPRDLASPETVH